MMNRIRDFRKAKGMTLADLAEACTPPTTAQTIGRLETGMRGLSLEWMERIAPALGVEPQALMHTKDSSAPQIVARLLESGAEAFAKPASAISPADFASTDPFLVIQVEASIGEYRAGDQIWLRQMSPDKAGNAINRDCLVPRAGGRFAFGRLIDRRESLVGILPPGLGQKQQVVDNPAWIAIAELLIRKM